MGIENMSIEQLEDFEDSVPEIGGFPSRYLAAKRGYSEWIAKLYKDIDHIIKNIIFPSASYRQNDPEDRFNVDIASNLAQVGYRAHHDKWMNGHPDIYVDSHRGYKWIGESKLHSDYETLLEGFRQLSTRYSSGFVGQNHGAVLIVTKNQSISNLMEKWQEKLLSSEFQGVEVKECKMDTTCFLSAHDHPVTGEKYTVRHIPISILFNPTDKSARNRKTES
ncbi:conserved hypothetical protein [Vibrio jasicida]|uniref:Restriction endonuclease n=1 Tax=Vibrio jasicida TaxID=766224 RepID=A0AAU9QWI0_9VIBR|nr:conserved hypothetical protein [Vibrio jasicida]CAH1603525.1 conserved hypothetical protein [Vibrio jasicida]